MDNPANSRRKLLRGSLAAPLVLTVASPSALAATSFTKCIANAANQPQPPAAAFVTSADAWHRTAISIYRGKLKSTGTLADFYEKGGLYYPLNSCTTGYLASDFTGNNVPAFLEKRLALVYVNNSGSVVGFGPCPNGGYAVPTSCWASFNSG